VQRLAIGGHRRHYGDIAVYELLREGVLLANGVIGPALGAIELGDDRRIVLDADLVDAVFVAIERKQMAVRAVAERIHAVEDDVGRQRGEGMRRTHGSTTTWAVARHGNSGCGDWRVEWCIRPPVATRALLY